MPTSNTQSEFPGWATGRARCMAIIYMSVQGLGQLLKRQVHSDHETRYLWFESDKIGRFTIVGDNRQTLQAAEIYVEIDCDRVAAFKEIIAEVIEKLPDDVSVSLEDEIDYDRAEKLRQATPPNGPW